MYCTPTGLAELDALLEGGLPCGAFTEIVGPGESLAPIAQAIIRSQQARHPNARTIYLDLAAEADREQFQAAGIDPDTLYHITLANFDEVEQRLVQPHVPGEEGDPPWAGILVTGLPAGCDTAPEIVAIWRTLARLIADTHLFAVILTTPDNTEPVPAQRDRALRRLACVRLRLAELVAGPSHTITAALLKHPFAPTGRTARVVLVPAAGA